MRQRERHPYYMNRKWGQSRERERKEEVPAPLADKCTKGQKTESEREREMKRAYVQK
jgi:hypothetical protein